MKIFKSILDIDKYKLIMMQYIYYSGNKDVQVQWKFTNRSKNVNIDNRAKRTIMKTLATQIKRAHGMPFTDKELAYLLTYNFHPSRIIKNEFLEYLGTFKLNSNLVYIFEDEITVKGSWIETTLWETIILCLYNEIYCKTIAGKHYNTLIDFVGINKAKNKVNMLNNLGYDIPIVEFGTRRRSGREFQDKLIEILKGTKSFLGTSNMYLSMKHDVPCFGTMAHELFMFEAAYNCEKTQDNLINSQKDVMNKWTELYKDNSMNMFLSDTFGTEAFLKDFKELGLYKEEFNSGVRHDSGDPITFAKRMKSFYEEVGVDPSMKKIMFSDGLTVKSAIEIYEEVKDYCIPVFGIGTHLTNDCEIPTLSIVCKLNKVVNSDTVKISDNSNKACCSNQDTLNKYIKVFDYKNIESNNTELIV